LERWFFYPSPPAGGGKLRCDEYMTSNSRELGIKKRGSKAGLEVKGLLGTFSDAELVRWAPHCELWCKWSLNDLVLNSSKVLVTKKMRWARKLDTSRASVVEVPLGADELPLDGRWVKEGCNLTLTKVEIAGIPGQWWTFCFEAFGSVESAPNNLKAAMDYAASNSLRKLRGDFLSYPAWLCEVAA
jgi:hypothetical protein